MTFYRNKFQLKVALWHGFYQLHKIALILSIFKQLKELRAIVILHTITHVIHKLLSS